MGFCIFLTSFQGGSYMQARLKKWSSSVSVLGQSPEGPGWGRSGSKGQVWSHWSHRCPVLVRLAQGWKCHSEQRYPQPTFCWSGRYLVKSREVRVVGGLARSCRLTTSADSAGLARRAQAGLRSCECLCSAPLSLSSKLCSGPAPSPCRRSPEAETSPTSLDLNAWVTPTPSPVGKGEEGRAVGGESRPSAPSQGSLCHDPGSHPHISGLTHKVGSKAHVFSTATT